MNNDFVQVSEASTVVTLINLRNYYVHQPAKKRIDGTILLVKKPITDMVPPDTILKVSNDKVISKIKVSNLLKIND